VLDGVVVKGRFNVYKHIRNEHMDLVSVVRGLVKSLAGVVADGGAE
jgi:ADP-heptose:LPS heptosyltransferase